MRSDGYVLKYLTHVFPIGTILRKYALPENGKSRFFDVKTGKIVSFRQNGPCWMWHRRVGPGDQTGRPCIRRLVGSVFMSQDKATCPMKTGPCNSPVRRCRTSPHALGWVEILTLILYNLEVFLSNAADGAYPVFGNIFKRSARSNAAFGITYLGVVNPVTYSANVLLHKFVS